MICLTISIQLSNATHNIRHAHSVLPLTPSQNWTVRISAVSVAGVHEHVFANCVLTN